MKSKLAGRLTELERSLPTAREPGVVCVDDAGVIMDDGSGGPWIGRRLEDFLSDPNRRRGVTILGGGVDLAVVTGKKKAPADLQEPERRS
jgi:hypothetical protein